LKAKGVLIFSSSLILFILLLLPQSFVLAGTTSAEDQPGTADDYCLSCHDVTGLTTTLPSGEEIYISVDRVMHATSIHGRLGYACVQCHTDIDDYPHREIPAQTHREYSVYQNESCARCHPGSAEANESGAHQIFMDAGILEAAICSDCHGYHNVDSVTPPRSNIPKTCERCHSQIYQEYKDSAHGAALIGEGNPDVPDCATCHNNHNIKGPNSSDSFHLFSPLICEECHANEVLMNKYGISTHVFETYVSDFHGTTVTVFEQISPDQETNKPVCIDCHGVHNMKSASDPESQVMKDNLLETCQKCHPDAAENFSSAWLGHYEPSIDKYPLLFFVDIFYKIVIPVTITGMLAFVAIDAQYRIRKKISEKKIAKVEK
jgi:hypothetical protein